MPPSFSFFQFSLPNGEQAWIPDDIELRLPNPSTLERRDLHCLIYPPWHRRYLEKVEPAWRDFFKVVLPHLHARSVDVHVVTCLPFIKELIQAAEGPVDEQVAHIAFILHDSGWSRMSELEIAHSLGMQGLSLSEEAVNPKLKHALLGQKIAQKILDGYPFQPPLTLEQIELIYRIILFHDRPWELAGGGIPITLKVVCDTDHLWSFTHLNFWQDTLRKGVRADSYLRNLTADLDNYFVSEPGKQKARQLLKERSVEVEAWKRWDLLAGQ